MDTKNYINFVRFNCDNPKIKYLCIKMNNNGKLKDYYVNDLKWRNKIIEMNKDYNEHIFEIFDTDMLLYLHELKISYKYLSRFVIDDNTSEYNIEYIIYNFLNVFHSKDYVLSLSYHKLCKRLGLADIFHPKFQKGRPKIYNDDELADRRREQNKMAYLKYSQTAKGKISIANCSKRYRDKHKLLAIV